MLEWEEIHGFVSPGEYKRFVQYIEAQVADGIVKELSVNPKCGKGMIYGGRWFEDLSTGAIWRLVPPDVPFRGLWEPIVEGLSE